MRLGFIGCGNMASAMIAGIVEKEVLQPHEIVISALHEETKERVKKAHGVTVATSNCMVVEQSDIIVLAVKPQYYVQVIQEIRYTVKPEQIIVSIAPGKTLEWFTEQFGKNTKLVRTMPNTPAMVGEGMTGVCCNNFVTTQELNTVCEILRGFGKVEVIGEHLMDAVVSVSGSSPAYVFMFVEAMADAAVAEGMPRTQAYQFAAQAIIGSAKMVMETGMHPGALKDMVCSPGGSTIEAVRVLEERGFRSAVIEAMKACANKSKNM